MVDLWLILGMECFCCGEEEKDSTTRLLASFVFDCIHGRARASRPFISIAAIAIAIAINAAVVAIAIAIDINAAAAAALSHRDD